MSWYTKKAAGVQDPNEYTAVVDVSVWGIENSDIEVEAGRVAIKFRIDIEAREWGIKNISAYVYGMVIVPLFISYLDETKPVESKEITVDLSKVKVTESDGRGIVTLGDLDLYLDTNFNVNYEQTTLEILK